MARMTIVRVGTEFHMDEVPGNGNAVRHQHNGQVSLEVHYMTGPDAEVRVLTLTGQEEDFKEGYREPTEGERLFERLHSAAMDLADYDLKGELET